MKNKEPSLIITFSDDNPTKEECKKALIEYVYTIIKWYKEDKGKEHLNKKFDFPCG